MLNHRAKREIEKEALSQTMKKHNVEPPQESLYQISETRLSRLNQTGVKSGCNGSTYITENGQMVFGLEVASKVFKIICDVELGKPDMNP